MNKHLILFLFFLNSNCLIAQSFKYRNYKFDWSQYKVTPINVEDTFKNEDAVILSEKCIYNQGGNKVPSYYYVNYIANYAFIDESTQGKNPIIQKHLRIKFLTQRGIEKFSRFVFPESFDPLNDIYCIPPQKRDSLNRPVGTFECIRYFAARIIKSDLSIKEATVEERTSNTFLSGDRGIETYYNWIFRITNLQPGDELELDYSYEGSYNFGKSNRIFLNSDIPKQVLDFTFRFPETETMILTYHNGLLPVDSGSVTKTSPNYYEYYFHLVNLQGGIREPGGRPYLQFPYFTFYRHKLDYGIEDPKSKYIKKALPYPWPYIMLPYAGYQYQDLKLKLTRSDNTTQVLNNFTDSMKQKSNDTSAAAVVTTMQHVIADNFDYAEDEGYYFNREPELEKLGKNIENKTMRQMSRHRIYDEVLLRLEKPYFHSILCDKRINSIDINRFESLTATRTGIAVPYKDYMIHFYPKSYRFGYESNELPFYYEDTYTLLIPQNQDWKKRFELVPSVQFKFVKTPLSTLNDNSRSTSGIVKLSLDSMKVKMNLKINLSGQFSTLTRGYYKYGSIDSTINPEYYSAVALIADDYSKIKNQVSKTNLNFPFETTVNQEFDATNILKKSGPLKYEISLEGFFNNVIEEDFTSINRHLDYYTDFLSQDIHRYFFHFDHKITLINSDTFNKKTENNFTIYELKLSQPNENDLLLESSYIVKARMVPAMETANVEEVFKFIKKLNNTSMKILLKD